MVKKGKKKRKKKKTEVTYFPDLDDLMEESEVVSRTQSPEQELDPEMDEIPEEEPLFIVPPLPQLPEKGKLINIIHQRPVVQKLAQTQG